VWRKLLSPIYRRDVMELRVIDMRSPAADQIVARAPAPDVECIVLESAEDWRRLSLELPRRFRYTSDQVRAFLEEGYTVFLALLDSGDGSAAEIAGYSLQERGVVDVFGEKIRVGPDVVFSHFTEVLPEHRGRRIQAELSRFRTVYGRQHGINKRCTWVGGRNRPALLATSRGAGVAIAELEEVSILGGLIRRHTPREEVERALAAYEVRQSATRTGGLE
jgi:GNAT superfamily N-acetyltransferase